MKTKCVIFDIDGTLANLDHRMHHLSGIKIDCECVDNPIGSYCLTCNDTGIVGKPDWEAFHEECHLDEPIPEIVKLLHLLSEDYEIIYCTGRMEINREVTRKWLTDHVSEHEHLLFMRLDGDLRSDFLIKKEFIQALRNINYEVIMAFEDRDRNVKMYRDEGIVCLQVKEGAY